MNLWIKLKKDIEVSKRVINDLLIEGIKI